MGDSISIGAAYRDQDISGATSLSGATVTATSSLAHTGTLGFYGKTPAVQRPYTSAVHLSSELASSADFGATQLAVVNELQATMVALGIWATA